MDYMDANRRVPEMNRYLAQRMVVDVTCRLMAAARSCPSRYNRAEFDDYQTTVMQPLHNELGQYTDRLHAVGGRLW